MDFKVKIEEGKPLTEIHLRIIEHSRGYEMTNSRYGEYKEEMRAKQNKLRTGGLADSENALVGWAPYKPHGAIGQGPFYYAPGFCKGTPEYRKAKVERQSDDTANPLYNKITCTWLVPSAGELGGEMVLENVRNDDEVLFTGPGAGNFKIEADIDPQIKEKREQLYKEAITFANQRVPLRQIVQDLNRSLEEFYVLRKEEVTGLPKPKKITFENVQAKVQQAKVDAEIKKAKAKQALNN
jgi:hypothetical protein